MGHCEMLIENNVKKSCCGLIWGVPPTLLWAEMNNTKTSGWAEIWSRIPTEYEVEVRKARA